MNSAGTARPRPPGRTSGRGRKVVAGVVLGVVALVGSACAGADPSTSAAGSSGTLNVGFVVAPTSLDPAKQTGDATMYMQLAYDPLIYQAADGSLQPRLALSWSWVGAGNSALELKLRPDVAFSDGSRLTSQLVKDNLEYIKSAGGAISSLIKPVTTIDTPDPLTVRINLSAPDPDLPLFLSQTQMIGPIGAEGLKDTASLATKTAGAGPYILDTAQTVPNDHYTYTPNPTYWDKASVHYGKVVIKVLPNPNTALAAIKTGQVDVTLGDYTTMDSAKSAGLNVAYTPLNALGLALADRAGALVPALADQRVRQALNYAVDRKKIANALFGQYGTPTEQTQLPGTDGHSEKDFYTYDPAKAKQLLTEAGYPNGFTLPVLTTTQQSGNLVAQAMAEDLKQIGVQLQLTNEANSANYITDIMSKKWPAYGLLFGSLPVHTMAPVLVLPGGPYNPFDSPDPALQSLYDKAAAADDTARSGFDAQLTARVVELGWFVPVVFAPYTFFSRPNVTGVQVTAARAQSDPIEWRPAG